MNVNFTKRFSASLDELNDKALLKKVGTVVKNVMQAKSLKDISNLKKLHGHSSAFRIRVGDYRIGFFLEKDEVLFAILEHRKKIYDSFP